MKNLEKTKKNHERLASALRENLLRRKHRSRDLVENPREVAANAAGTDEKTVHSNPPPEGSDISAN